MFVGHYSVSLIAASSPRAPRLGTLFVAAQVLDYGFFSFALLGIEHMRLVPGMTRMNAMDLYDMPWTHSLLGACCWSAGFALLLWLLSRRPAAALIGGLVVFSHWLLDLLVHRPDLTIAGSPPPLGLGLWNLPLVEMPLEIALAVLGLVWFARATRPAGKAGRWSLIVLGVAMAVFQTVNWTTPQPPTVMDPAPASGAALGLIVYTVLALIAWWVGTTRAVSGSEATRRPSTIGG